MQSIARQKRIICSGYTCSRQRTMSVLPTRAAVTRGVSSHDSKLNAEQSRRKKTKLRLCTLAPHLSKNRTSGRLREVMAWNSAVLRSFDDWLTSITVDELRTSCSTSWSRPLRQALTNFSCSSELGRPARFFCAHRYKPLESSVTIHNEIIMTHNDILVVIQFVSGAYISQLYLSTYFFWMFLLPPPRRFCIRLRFFSLSVCKQNYLSSYRNCA